MALLALDGSNYVASIETGHVFVPKTPETFTYEADGNLTLNGRWNYTWDAENRLIKVESRPDTPSRSWRRIEWTYDALGRRIQQVTLIWTNNAWFMVENMKFVSDPMLFGRQIVELNGTNNTLVRSYAWGLDLSGTMDGAGGGSGLAWVTLHTASSPASGTHFVCYDGNGNIVALVNAATGDITARYEYGPFGEPIRVSGPAASLNPFRFSTKRTENNTDLVLYEYRAYSQSLGRWLTRDPIEEKSAKEFGLEGLLRKVDRKGIHFFYLFVENDPIRGIDLLGLQDTVPQWPPLSADLSPVGYDSCCCDYKKIQEGRDWLKQAYEEAKEFLDTSGVKRDPYGEEGVSCHDSNFAILQYMTPTPPCWLCTMERRREPKPVGYPLVAWWDENFIVCVSVPRGYTIVFDWFAGKSPGEDYVSFIEKYPYFEQRNNWMVWNDCSKRVERQPKNYDWLKGFVQPVKKQ